MRNTQIFSISNKPAFKKKLLFWLQNFETSCLFESPDYQKDKYSTFSFLAGAGCVKKCEVNKDGFKHFQEFAKKNRDWLFGFFTYDLKNETENLFSNNIDNLHFPLLHFFVPRYIFQLSGNSLKIFFFPKDEKNIDRIFEDILTTKIDITPKRSKVSIQNRISRKEYLKNVETLQHHIVRGDIYEANYCQEFFVENTQFNPYQLYTDLSKASPMPFGAFYRCGDKFLIAASPERYLKKTGRSIVSQPIKGTAKRTTNTILDEMLKKKLQNNTKERAENIMIVDLVRNDLSKIAVKDSVKVDELCAIYSFPKVHQMISTISATLKKDSNFVETIKQTFPMGSMTGAPKLSAMKLIERYEKTKRGLYSGAVGYITPERNFDFSVIIRSLLYNSTQKYLSFSVGSAITAKSNPVVEYDECLLKAKAIRSVLKKY